MTRHPFSRLVGNAFSKAHLMTLAALTGLLVPEAVHAQGGGCTLQPVGLPARQVLHCPTGLQLEAEAGADYTLTDRNRDGQPDSVNLGSRALLIEVGAQPRGAGFQVRTPQAIAAVRGTQWAVEVGTGKTAVFVLRGRVAVRRINARDSVELEPGEGVDVEPGTTPLTVRRWPVARANALLARFGRQIR
jgi:ferric-dicitrate binding protein FerR (iron transport regulator)